MILAKGTLYESSEQERLLGRLEEEINQTLAEQVLDAETVAAALECLGKQAEAGAFDDWIASLDLDGAQEYKQLIVDQLRRGNQEYKMQVELGGVPGRCHAAVLPDGRPGVTVQEKPLGTLLHIAAGNVDGLPAFSVAEGLLTGNVNILKLPQADKGLSVAVLQALIDIEPRIADFLYVFDTPSTDLPAMARMAALADGVVVWGGDAAVSAVRRLAAPGTRLIEWGHKLGFAYIAGYEDKQTELAALAEHIVTTRQLLCSSCQTIFLDTARMEDVYAFCEDFLPLLDEAASLHPAGSIGAAAEITLRRYTQRLEDALTGRRTAERAYQGRECRLLACCDHRLELSPMFGCGLVKRLPREALFASLRQHKGYLQTAGLICDAGERESLADLLARCGVTRITRAGHMSAFFPGEAHDGEYPLRRYQRIVNVE